MVIDSGSMDEPGSIGDYATGTATPEADRLPDFPRNLQLRPDDQTIAAVWEAPQDVGNPGAGRLRGAVAHRRLLLRFGI